MIKLTFYTTDKQVTVDMGNMHHENYTDIPTVQVRDGYYEVMKKDGEKSKPILRVPISQTIMFIQD